MWEHSSRDAHSMDVRTGPGGRFALIDVRGERGEIVGAGDTEYAAALERSGAEYVDDPRHPQPAVRRVPIRTFPGYGTPEWESLREQWTPPADWRDDFAQQRGIQPPAK